MLIPVFSIMAAVVVTSTGSMTSCPGSMIPMCDVSCTTFGFCYQFLDGTFGFIPAENCPAYCTEGGCSNVTDTGSGRCKYRNSGSISCAADGIYPDPYDCRRSLYCTGDGSVSVCTDCGSQYYNSRTGQCEKDKMKNGNCPIINVSICEDVGQMRAFVGDERFYYICTSSGNIELTPLMMRCPSGTEFNSTSRFCEASDNAITGESGESCSATTTTSDSSSGTGTATTASSGSSAGTTTTAPPATCTQEGYFPDSSNCRSYYYCDGSLNIMHITCLPNHHYDQTLQRCVYGDCI